LRTNRTHHSKFILEHHPGSTAWAEINIHVSRHDRPAESIPLFPCILIDDEGDACADQTYDEQNDLP
jgi:hypothetical protein